MSAARRKHRKLDLSSLFDRETAQKDISDLMVLRDSRVWELVCAYCADRVERSVKEALAMTNTMDIVRFHAGRVDMAEEVVTRAIPELMRLARYVQGEK